MSFKILNILLVAHVFIVSAGFVSAASFSGRVIKVSDGDTIHVMNNNVAEKVRLDGIDSPESGQAYGRQAKEFTADMVAGKVVTVEVKDTDRYGRTVGEVFCLDGRSLNRAIVQAGYAWWFKKYSNDASLGELEEGARIARKGLWRDPSPKPPWEWRAETKIGGSSLEVSKSAATTTTAVLYHGNSRSNVFHQPVCKDYNCKNCTIGIATRDEAIYLGYRPCGMCRP